jgi:hypothetical protein
LPAHPPVPPTPARTRVRRLAGAGSPARTPGPDPLWTESDRIERRRYRHLRATTPFPREQRRYRPPAVHPPSCSWRSPPPMPPTRTPPAPSQRPPPRRCCALVCSIYYPSCLHQLALGSLRTWMASSLGPPDRPPNVLDWPSLASRLPPCSCHVPSHSALAPRPAFTRPGSAHHYCCPSERRRTQHVAPRRFIGDACPHRPARLSTGSSVSTRDLLATSHEGSSVASAHTDPFIRPLPRPCAPLLRRPGLMTAPARTANGVLTNPALMQVPASFATGPRESEIPGPEALPFR